MSSKKKQSNSARFFRSRGFVAMIVVAVLLIGYAYGQALYRDYQLKQEIQKLQDDIRSLETKKLESLEILDYVMSDAFVEREARTALNMRAPGESVFVVMQEDYTPGEIINTPDDEEDLINPIKWWYYFTHKQTN